MPNSRQNKILSIDPGVERVGAAIFDGNNLIHSECIVTSSKDLFPTRLVSIVKNIERLIEEHKSNTLAIEKLFFNTNQTTAMRVSEVRGAIIHAAASRGMDIFEFTPLQIKAAVTGHGKSDKIQVIKMVEAIAKPRDGIRYDDEYDAIAIGITCGAFIGNQRRP